MSKEIRRTRLRRVGVNLNANVRKFPLRSYGETHPTQRYQFPLFCELHDQLLFIHRTRVARRVLLGDEQRRDDISVAFVLSQQKAARLTITRGVDTGD